MEGKEGGIREGRKLSEIKRRKVKERGERGKK